MEKIKKTKQTKKAFTPEAEYGINWLFPINLLIVNLMKRTIKTD